MSNFDCKIFFFFSTFLTPFNLYILITCYIYVNEEINHITIFSFSEVQASIMATSFETNSNDKGLKFLVSLPW